MSTEERSDPIERRVGGALSRTGATVALAESCTGGLIASLLTDIPGASEYVDRSLVAYAYDAHRTLLGVSRETLDAHGTVSEESARQMAQAARDGADTTWGLAATGVLGPGGGTPEKPVGTVFVGVAYAGEWGSGTSETSVTRYALDGERREMKERVARNALGDLHEAVLAR
jgi:nicotinamide-nucleotide amidase